MDSGTHSAEQGTNSAEQTEAAGARLAAGLAPGDVVLVRGELGTGKTTLVRGACRALGVGEPVTSPTFTIGQVYRAPTSDGELEVAHLDLYRVTEPAAEDPGLIEDYLTADRVAFVECADERAWAHLEPTVTVAIEHAGGDARVLTVA